MLAEDAKKGNFHKWSCKLVSTIMQNTVELPPKTKAPGRASIPITVERDQYVEGRPILPRSSQFSPQESTRLSTHRRQCGMLGIQHCSAIEKKEVSAFAAMYAETENIMLTKIMQAPKGEMSTTCSHR